MLNILLVLNPNLPYYWYSIYITSLVIFLKAGDSCLSQNPAQILDFSAIAKKTLKWGFSFGLFLATFGAFGEVLALDLTRCHTEIPEFDISEDFSAASGEIFSQNLTRCPKNC